MSGILFISLGINFFGIIIGGLFYIYYRNSLREQISKTIFHSLSEGFLMIRKKDQAILYSNECFDRIFGYRPKELSGKNAGLLGFPREGSIKNKRKMRKIIRSLKKKGSWAGELTLIKKSQSLIHCRVSMLESEINKYGWVWLVLFIDVTGEKKSRMQLRQNEKKWRTLFEILPVGVSLLDKSGKIIEMNPALLKILKSKQKALVNGEYKHRSYIDRNGFEMAASDFPSSLAIKTQKEVKNKEIGVVTEEGDTIWTDVSAAPLHLEDMSCAIATMDITRRIENERKLLDSEERFKTFIEKAPVGILLTRPSGEVISVNPAGCAMLGMSEEEIKTGGRSAVIDKTDPRLKEALAEREKTGEIHAKRMRLVRKSGEKFEAEISSVIFKDKNGDIYTSMIVDDISERNRIENQIRYMADYDQLTQVPNRYLFNDRFRQAIASNRRNKTNSALIFIDLDKFKNLNDKHGHSAGDLLLIKAAQKLLGTVRESDTIARFGGDEFVIILEGLETCEEEAAKKAYHVAEKILKKFREPFSLRLMEQEREPVQIEYVCTASMGVKVFSCDINEDEVLRNADRAMYQSKKSGGNAITMLNEKLQTNKSA